MDWFKVDARIGTNPKIHALSAHAYRTLTFMWGHAMLHETGGLIPETATTLIPHTRRKQLDELERCGFIHQNGAGWVIHDWDDHQGEALIVQEKKRRDAERKRDAYAKHKRDEKIAEASIDISEEYPRRSPRISPR